MNTQPEKQCEHLSLPVNMAVGSCRSEQCYQCTCENPKTTQFCLPVIKAACNKNEHRLSKDKTKFRGKSVCSECPFHTERQPKNGEDQQD
jgi:hypothetical protein